MHNEYHTIVAPKKTQKWCAIDNWVQILGQEAPAVRFFLDKKTVQYQVYVYNTPIVAISVERSNHNQIRFVKTLEYIGFYVFDGS